MSRGSGKSINTKKLVEKIDKITKEKMSREKVVSLDDFRALKKKDDPKTILIIEDDETMRLALKRIFESDGYRVLAAADGTQLSQVLDDGPIELIVLDVGLPWINGFELCTLLKENEDLRGIPVVFVSGKTTDLDVRRGFDVGCDDYIKKPFDVDEIKSSVRTLLKLR
ncbi:MAG: response regulator [Oligoflexia bacterium]|nr:response regulator [Oligoflexia bacterium]